MANKKSKAKKKSKKDKMLLNKIVVLNHVIESTRGEITPVYDNDDMITLKGKMYKLVNKL